MSFAGAGTRVVSVTTHAAGVPGGSIDVVLELQPLGSYPALGELVTDLLALSALGTKVKVVAGVKPDIILVEDSKGLGFSGDAITGTIRNWASVGTEHATAVYTAGELASTFRVLLKFPLFGSMSR